jgi:hypothetical protein
LESIKKFQSKRERQQLKVEESETELQSDETQEKKDLIKSLLKRLTHSIAAMSAHGEQHNLMMMHTTMSAGVMVNRTALNTAERLGVAERTLCSCQSIVREGMRRGSYVRCALIYLICSKQILTCFHIWSTLPNNHYATRILPKTQ